MKSILTFFSKKASKIDCVSEKVAKIGCVCERLPPNYKNYISSYLGQDSTNGRYADITIEKCIHCERNWVKYLVEFERFSKSGRFYMGIVAENDLPKLTPKNTIMYIEKLDWYIYGGSYFSTNGEFGKGKAKVDF